jgi:hypothetical protein
MAGRYASNLWCAQASSQKVKQSAYLLGASFGGLENDKSRFLEACTREDLRDRQCVIVFQLTGTVSGALLCLKGKYRSVAQRDRWSCGTRLEILDSRSSDGGAQ